MALIPTPDLEIRTEDQFAAQAISRISGGLTVELLQAQIRERQELLKMALAGTLPSQPICPELTNANPSSPHTVLLEVFAWMLAQIGYRINQIPEQNLIAFARVFGVELKTATAATAVLRFTIAAPSGTIVTIPAGTEISDESGDFAFQIIKTLQIVSPATFGDATARRTSFGHILLAANVLTNLVDPIAFVENVTNPLGVDSGSELETVDSALERARQYQRRGERIVSDKDLEEAISDALDGNAIVRVFPFVKNGLFDSSRQYAGYTSVVIMTTSGTAIDDTARSTVAALFETVVGNQFITLSDPIFVNFDVSAKVKLTSTIAQTSTLAAIEKNLRDFYGAARENFGRPISRSEIIAVIEATSGVDRIVSEANAPILASPLVDLRVKFYELPRLVSVIINAV